MKLSSNIRFILKHIKNSGYQAYIIGGAVRNYLLNCSYSDIDIATDATPNEILCLFPNSNIKKKYIDIGHIIIQIDNEIVEITTFREEQYIFGKRYPQSVKFINSLRLDVQRRDFTINAIAYDIDIGYIDFLNGFEDLSNYTIRCIGNANIKFKEDPLRILRAIRLSIEYELNIEKNTFNEIINNIELINEISTVKLNQELKKIILSKNFSKYINKYKILFSTLFKKLSLFSSLNNEYINLDSHLYILIEKTLNDINQYEHKLATLLLFLDTDTSYKCLRKFLFDLGNNTCFVNKIIKIIENINLICNLNKLTNGIVILFNGYLDFTNTIKIIINLNKSSHHINLENKSLNKLLNRFTNENFTNKLAIKGDEIISIAPSIQKNNLSSIIVELKKQIITGELLNEYDQIKAYIIKNY